MKNKSTTNVQLTIGQNKLSSINCAAPTVQVNSWVNTALAKKDIDYNKSASSQMVKVHFAFSKSILNKR